jgi:hypothetical protein
MPVLRRQVTLLALGIALLAAGCGGDDEASPAELSPEQVRENLIDAGYETGEVLTEGANQAVVDGKDAEAYLSIDASPEGERIYVSIYFFEGERLAEALDEQFDESDDQSSAHELRETRLYNVAGTQEQLDGVIEAAESG